MTITSFNGIKINSFEKLNKTVSKFRIKNSIQSIINSVKWDNNDYTISTKFLDKKEIEKKYKTYFLSKQDIIVGYISAIFESNKCYIAQIAVSEDEQRKGYGKILMNKIFEKSIKKEIPTVKLHCENKNFNFYDFFAYPKSTTLTDRKYSNGESLYKIVYTMPLFKPSCITNYFKGDIL